MSDRTLFWFSWALGSAVSLLAIPFLPRSEVRTPFHAIGMAIMLGAMWPALLLVALVKYAPWWYWLSWVQYREFLIANKVIKLKKDFSERWQLPDQVQFPEVYKRQKERLEHDLSRLEDKSNRLFYRKRILEGKLRD